LGLYFVIRIESKRQRHKDTEERGKAGNVSQATPGQATGKVGGRENIQLTTVRAKVGFPGNGPTPQNSTILS